MNSFDETKHFLGSLCKRGHDYQGTGKSLRYLSCSRRCVDCNREKGKKKRDRDRGYELKTFEQYLEETRQNYPEIDASQYFLGQPCRQGHTWNNSGLALRYLSGRTCVECKRQYYDNCREQILEYKSKYYQQNRERKQLYNRSYQQQHLEQIKEKQAKYRQLNKHQRRAYMREYYKRRRQEKSAYNKQYRENNRSKLIEYGRAKYQADRDKILAQKREDRKLNPEKHKQKDFRQYHKHRETILARNKIWRRTERGRLVRRQLERKREAIKKQNHHVRYTPEQEKQLLAAFQGNCAYCGSQEGMTIDHFIPISEGGPDVPGNLLPACRSCNSSKQSKDPKDWYQRQPFYSLKRWRHILKVLGKTETNYNQLPLI